HGFNASSHRQVRKYWRHSSHFAGPRRTARGTAARGDFLGRRILLFGNFERHPGFGSPHRSRHEGVEARADVWGDAAGTAPAVTSVTRLSLRCRLRLPGTSQIRFDSAPFGRATCFWLFSRRTARTGECTATL